MPLGSVTTQLLFNPPYYEGTVANSDFLTASSAGFVVTPAVHVSASDEVGSFVTCTGTGGITLGTYFVVALSGGGYQLDRSCGSNGQTSVTWRIGGNTPFPNSFAGAGVGLNVGGSHSTTEGNNFSNVSDPGCIQIQAAPNATTGAAYICQAYSGMTPFALDWEMLGVPIGKFVVKVDGRCRAKVVTVSGTVTNAFLKIGVVLPVGASDPFGQFVFDTVPKDAGWATYGNRSFCIDEIDSPSDTPLRILLETTGSVSDSSQVQVLVDTVEMTIYYDDQWCDYCTAMAISPSTVTLQVGQSQNFTTNLDADFSIVEGGDSGTLTNVADRSVTYTAGSAPGTYHLLAQDQCVVGNDDTATITVIDTLPQIYFQGYLMPEGNAIDFSCIGYGAPTGFLLSDPISAGLYILESNIADLNGLRPGDSVRIKIRRDGDNPNDTSNAPCSLRLVEVSYDKV